ncbi:hypothetical protein H4R19_001352 [Coemansia spiralis]|nr:hypothetical protein H4R19_001352 [Coemansia spiralis]
MAKKFTGENTKVKAAKEKKAEAQAEKDAKSRQKKDAEETKQWNAGAKQAGKKEDLEAKRLEKLARKKEADALLDSENKANAKPKPPTASIKPPAPRGAAKKAAAKEEKVAAAAAEQPPAQVETYAARNIDDALALLDAIDMSADVPIGKATADAPAGAPAKAPAPRPVAAGQIDRHPERRMKATFAAYTERMLPVIKEEHPGLRQSQMKDIIFKRWQKAPENPFNQAHAAYDSTQADVVQIVNQEKQQVKDRLRAD